MPSDRVSDYPEALRRDAAKHKRRLRDAEAEIERVRADTAKEVARLTESVANAERRARTAEAKLVEAKRADR